MVLKIRLAKAGDGGVLIRLVVEFRQSLAQLRGKDRSADLESANDELSSYQEKEFPIFVAEGAEPGVLDFGYALLPADWGQG